ncbi:MAG: 3-phosphoserine/phosphohydroxythreonine transaminase [Clostridiales bacterium]|nr:3-phosphoserine/phosphohydroxythreonine transaminase [Clostridiales bacterium]
MERVYNFAAGPAAMPLPALERAQKELLSYGTTGMSVMEMSHRSKMYLEIYQYTEAAFRSVMNIPDDYAVLFLAGGATGEFSAIPMNLLPEDGIADYVDSGNFAHGAAVEAKKFGNIRIVASSREENYVRIPAFSLSDLDANAAYLHITTNNTIFGTRYTALPETGDIPLVADASSNILSEVYDIRKFGVMYAGAQKNIGPAGMAVLIVRKDLLGHPRANTPKIYDWTKQAESDSMINTPPTFTIYMAGLCLDWVKDQGGVSALEQVNIEKANMLYDCIDNSKLFKGTADKEFRSRMNVTFVTGNPDSDAAFVKEAASNGLVNLKGHRLVGGIRASIYNAMPIEGVKKLVDFMREYEVHHV